MISVLWASKSESGISSSRSVRSRSPRRSASGVAAATRSASSAPRLPGAGSRRSRPDSSLAPSSRALTCRSRRRALASIASRRTRRSPVSSSAPRRVLSGPRSRVSGVRSSWLTLAKKRVLASSSSFSSSFAFSRRSRSERSRRRVRRFETVARKVKSPAPARKKSGPIISRDGPWTARLMPLIEGHDQRAQHRQHRRLPGEEDADGEDDDDVAGEVVAGESAEQGGHQRDAGRRGEGARHHQRLRQPLGPPRVDAGEPDDIDRGDGEADEQEVRSPGRAPSPGRAARRSDRATSTDQSRKRDRSTNSPRLSSR